MASRWQMHHGCTKHRAQTSNIATNWAWRFKHAGSSLRIFLDGKIRSEFDGQLLDVEGKWNWQSGATHPRWVMLYVRLSSRWLQAGWNRSKEICCVACHFCLLLVVFCCYLLFVVFFAFIYHHSSVDGRSRTSWQDLHVSETLRSQVGKRCKSVRVKKG